jgi:hypothetical protein
MSGTWDANITLLYAAGLDNAAVVDTVRNGEAFDAVAAHKVTAGINPDYSLATSPPFIVCC